MLKRIKRGFEFNEENLALDVIREIGPGGTFMTHDHTVQWMRSAALFPHIAERDSRASWEQAGSLDAQGRAMQRAREILGLENMAGFPPEIDARIHAEFGGLVSGDLKLPDGW
jgi:trimethylamine--corrinoid protein Co-methyltransferase